ncbi:MAG: peptidylprolyl isomerase [Gemmatimonadaceae bacterium]|nr:peptidylprolyl isomerase [Gemmatimonadaceae bacterium]
MARVGASSLTRLELEAQVPGEAGLEQRRRFVGDWVRRQLLYQEALERQVHERPRIQRLVEQSREDVIVAAYLDSEFESRSIEIDPGEVRSYYDRNPGEFTRQEDEIRAQHIQVDSRRAAESLRQELLRDGGFDGRVAEVSLDEATAASSGDLGYFTARERPELWEACVDLRPGEVSDVVATGRGWHIVRLRDRQKAGSLRSLDEAGVRQNIEEALVREGYRGRIQALVDSLREEHSWEIDETMLRDR